MGVLARMASDENQPKTSPAGAPGAAPVQPAPDIRLLSRVEAARRLGCSVRHVRHLVSEGKLGRVTRTRGGVAQHLVPVADVEHMLRARGMRRAPAGGEAAALAFEMFGEFAEVGGGDDRALLRAVVTRLRLTPERARELWREWSTGLGEHEEARAAAAAAAEEREAAALAVREREALARTLEAASGGAAARHPKKPGGK